MGELHKQCQALHNFLLRPFGGGALPSCLTVSGTIFRYSEALAVIFKVAGDIQELILPPRDHSPARRDELWQTTCFECFVGVKNQKRYWEFNVAPCGHWNAFHFTDYRMGMGQEQVFQSLPSTIYVEADTFWLHCILDLHNIIRADHMLEAGISCVLEHVNGARSYWALCHPAETADFHHRDSFILQV